MNNINNIKENTKKFLKIKQTTLTQKEKEVINNLTIQDYEKMPSLAYNIANAHWVNNAIRGIKNLNYQYGTNLITLKEISPELFEKCKNHINNVVVEEIKNSNKLKGEIKKLTSNNINVDKKMLWDINNYHKGVKALKEINEAELSKLIAVVVYIIQTQGLETIRLIIDVYYKGARQKIYQRKNKKSYGELKY